MNSAVPEAPEPFSTDEARQVRAISAELVLPGIVDVHTHFMPQRVLDKVWAYFESAGPLTGRPWPAWILESWG